ncbi:phosphopyruvate hydratase [Candidatus Woesebacteria bacterium]|nr:MAG: phosphopyruvate hydratase [Candidatus Woesebacteria bacterium]
MSTITKIWAREILDSRGVPTVEAACQLGTGHIAVTSVPAGVSTGTHEAVEMRDLDEKRFLGKGVLKAVKNINDILGPSLSGMPVENQNAIDDKLIALDGSSNKSKMGSNAILAVSQVVAKVAAYANNTTVYRWIASLAQGVGLSPVVHVPSPIFNMVNGGLHGSGNLDFQEFQVIPASSKSYTEALRTGSEIYMTLGKNLDRRGAVHSVGDEGGYAPNLFTNADALEVVVESIKETNYSLGRDVFLGLDVAASVFYKNGEYTIRDKSTPLKDEGLMEYYKSINNQYHLAILEDAFHEDAWDSWKKLYAEMKDQVTIVGDDLLATNPQRVAKAISEKACDAILVKPNQIGTVTETLKVIKQTRDAGWKVIVSHRSGETNDWFIADFAVGVGADFVKFGAPARGERVEKYNRLLTIEQELLKH